MMTRTSRPAAHPSRRARAVARTAEGERAALLPLLLAAMAFLALALLPGLARADKADGEDLIARAELTLAKVQRHEDLGPYVRAYLKRAKAILIIPQLLKGGFIIGGEGGSGVLLARGDNGQWSYPAFFSIGAASIGLQIGGQSSEVLLLVMTGNGLTSILNDKVKIGGELDAAAGPYGAGLDASTTTNLDVDILSYSVAQGLYIGANFEGSVIVKRDELNADYYGQPATPEAIVLDGRVANPQADSLRRALSEAVR
ncbi:lipid-binding SYLF domain-containing protein [Marivibrio halodurans]|uniref:Lipid-binding SYLF domain-containing protein n=1 Tax=Marivibrio halodurans TaxID=2039722 RepID=A0A8J7V3R3_9PROT|nr:lipid-binding SYLF domain-containing protein [Marivibrio halodurans]MBP5858660.1 lipid-binding SYLF domain-containing protein [Marivibrio halodurans]